jgi:hypothetical protein
MATVTGFTAERMLEIENGTVVDGSISGSDLILVRRDGVEINAGNVRGPQGIQGPAGEVDQLSDLTDVDVSTGLVANRYLKFNGTDWIPSLVPKTIRQTLTYSLAGEIRVPVGSSDYLPLSPISLPTGQTASIVGYRWWLRFGTSFTFSIKRWRAGANTDLASAVVAAGTVGNNYQGGGSISPVTCNDLDCWGIEITAVSGSPSGGSVSLLVDVTV